MRNHELKLVAIHGIKILFSSNVFFNVGRVAVSGNTCLITLSLVSEGLAWLVLARRAEAFPRSLSEVEGNGGTARVDSSQAQDDISTSVHRICKNKKQILLSSNAFSGDGRVANM